MNMPLDVELRPSADGRYLCLGGSGCGAVVVDAERHARWHGQLAGFDKLTRLRKTADGWVPECDWTPDYG